MLLQNVESVQGPYYLLFLKQCLGTSTGKENQPVQHLKRGMVRTKDIQGPVDQSVVSLTSSLRVISLIDLAGSIYNILIFLLKKVSSFCTAKATHFFTAKISAYLRINRCKF